MASDILFSLPNHRPGLACRGFRAKGQSKQPNWPIFFGNRGGQSHQARDLARESTLLMTSETSSDADPIALKPVPANQSSFAKIIEQKFLYVDKTRMIHKLVTGRLAPYLLIRPRRFGKTILLDTIRNVYEGKKNLFAGLEIARLEYDWQPFPVIRIDMTDVNSDPDFFNESLTDLINTVAEEEHDVILDKVDYVTAIRDLIIRLSSRHEVWSQSVDAGKTGDRNNVVVLIDEYDAPVLDNIADFKKCESIRVKLHQFYRVLKAQARRMRALYITGITKFKRLSFFSVFNNVCDISNMSDFSTICGFTEKELRENFSGHFVSALKSLKDDNGIDPDATEESLVSEILSWYDGYSFDGLDTVLNPYSIVSFFANERKRFDDYWYKSGASLFTYDYGLNNKNFFKLFDSSLTPGSDFCVADPSFMDNAAVLLQAGYLTIASVEKSKTSDKYLLKIPNNEIRNAIVYEMLHMNIVPKDIFDPIAYLSDYYKDFINAFVSRDPERCESAFSSFITGFPSNLLGSSDVGEYVYHALLYCQLKAANLDVRCENRGINGISDIVVRTPQGDWIVVELKYEKSIGSPETVIGSDGHEPSASSPERHSTAKQSHRPGTTSPAPDGDSVSPGGSPPPLEVGGKTKRALQRLKYNVSRAFRQIVEKDYATPYVSERNRVFAAAVAVYGKSDVMFAFRDVVWSNELHRVVSYK
jgi:hypothetical protein